MTTTDLSITITHTYDQPPAVVFNAWVDPEVLRRWYAPVDGWVVGSARVSPGVGGSYEVTFGPAPGGDAYRESGTYTEFVASRRLAWTGVLEHDAARQLFVEVSFEEAAGGTVVTIVERGLGSEAQGADHAEGWGTALLQLQHLIVNL